MAAAEELFHLGDEGGRLPIRHVLSAVGVLHPVPCHVVDKTLPAPAVCGDRNTLHEAEDVLRNVHRATLPHPGTSHEDDIELREHGKVTLRNLALFTQECRDSGDGTPRMVVRWRFRFLGVLVVELEEVRH